MRTLPQQRPQPGRLPNHVQGDQEGRQSNQKTKDDRVPAA